MASLDFLNFLLGLPPAAAIAAISAFVSIVTTLVYKYTTNQKSLKEVKEKIKAMQAESRASKDPGRMAQTQREVMKLSMGQFSASTKSMVITIIPLFLLLGWMQSHLAYTPLAPGSEFTTTAYFSEGVSGNATLSAPGLELLSPETVAVAGGAASWSLKAANAGAYNLSYSFGDEAYSMPILVTESFRYENPVLKEGKGLKKDGSFERIVVGLEPLRPLGSLSLLGWRPGWLAAYIGVSLVLSMLLRKLLHIY